MAQRKSAASARGVAPSRVFAYTPRNDLTTGEKKIELEVGKYFFDNLPALLQEYQARFGNIIDRNNAQELYGPYAKNREARQRLSLATHEPAGALSDAVYFDQVAKKASPEKNIVLFNAGGQGSGKTTSLRFSGKSENAFIVMDGTMQDFEKSCRNIELAFAHKKNVHINYVYCPFAKAIANIISRAKDVHGGRVVNIKRAAKGHFQALSNIFTIVEKYRADTRFSFSVVDNTADEAAFMSLDDLAAKKYPSVDALEREGYAVLDGYFAALEESDPDISAELYQRLKGLPC